MRKLIVTGFRGNHGIYTVDTSNPSEITFVNPHGFYPYGIAKWNDCYVVGTEFRGLYIFDKDLSVIKIYNHIGTGLHDIRIVDNFAYVVVSDSNVIKVIDLETGEILNKINPNNCSEEEDIYHLNSLQIHNNKIYLSMFGCGDNDKEENHGSIIQINIDTLEFEKILYDRIEHPHSLYFVGDDMFYCESLKKRVYKNDEVVLETKMYPRGIAFDGEYFYIGESSDREIDSIESSCISIYNMDFELLQQIEMPCREIYEIFIAD